MQIIYNERYCEHFHTYAHNIVRVYVGLHTYVCKPTYIRTYVHTYVCIHVCINMLRILFILSIAVTFKSSQ